MLRPQHTDAASSAPTEFLTRSTPRHSPTFDPSLGRIQKVGFPKPLKLAILLCNENGNADCAEDAEYADFISVNHSFQRYQRPLFNPLTGHSGAGREIAARRSGTDRRRLVYRAGVSRVRFAQALVEQTCGANHRKRIWRQNSFHNTIFAIAQKSL